MRYIHTITLSHEGAIMQRVTNIAELQKHLEGILVRANHHAPKILNMVTILAGNVVLNCNSDSEGNPEIQTPSTTGPEDKTGNIMWCNIGVNRIYLTYDHDENSILIKAKSNRGAEIFCCNNTTSIKDINAFFTDLKRNPHPIAKM